MWVFCFNFEIMKQKGLFTRRLNTDKEERTLEQGEYRAALHARIGTSSQGNVNAVEPIQSNTIRTEGLTFTGVNKCIGTCQDIKNNAIIYCIWNSNKQHRIIRYTPSTQTVEDLLPLTWNVEVLNWLYVEGVRLSQKRLWNLRIVETGDYQLMFFTDGYNQPRRINLQLKDVRGTGAYTLTEDDIAVAKKPPLAPEVNLVLDATVNTSNIAQKMFQFSARYIYENGEISSLSPYFEISTDGITNGVGTKLAFTLYNAIDITINSGTNVKKIEFYVRQGNGTSEAGTVNPEWYRWLLLDNTLENTDITQRFYNTELLTPLSRTLSDINFFAVPQLAGCQEVVESNQVVYGDITEGYDKYEVEATVSAIFTEYEQLMYDEVAVTSELFTRRLGYLSATRQLSITEITPVSVFLNSPPQEGDLLILYVALNSPTTNFKQFTYKRILTASDISSALLDVVTWLSAALTADGIANTVTYIAGVEWQILLTNATYDYTTASFVIQSATYVLPVYSQSYVRNSFKEGTTHNLGLIYYDEYLRQSSLTTLPDIYVNSLTERYPLSGSFAYKQQSVALQVETSSKPPSWAKYYSIVHKSNINVTNSLVVTSVTENAEGNFEINILSSLSGLIDAGAKLDFIDFGTPNAKVRFLTRKYTWDNKQAALARQVISYDLVFNVNSYNATTGVITVSNPFNRLANYTDQIGEGSLIEIFVESPNVFYQERYFGNIIDGEFDTYDSGTDTSTFLLENGDTYRRWRQMDEGTSARPYLPIYHVESLSYSDYYESDFNSKGRPQIETPNQKQQRIPWMLRWGGKLFQDTEINNMSAFDAGNYKILSAKYGGVIGLREIGYTMKIVQEVNYSTAYIGRREITNADGSSQLVLTDNLIGQINDSNFGFGTKYAGSIIVNDNKMYFFDTTKMQVIREAGNAPFAISSYGMARYFREASGIIQNGDYEIITGFNKQEQSMYMTWFSNVLAEQNITYGAANVSETDPLVIAIDLPVPTLVVGDKIRVYQNTTSFIAEIEVITFGFYRLILISGTPNLNPITAISLFYVESSQETISFLEPERDSVEPGWTTNHDMEKTIDSKIVPIDMYGFIGGIFTTVLNADIYEHNATGNYLNLFGENKDFKIKSVFNLEPDASKVFLAHAVHSNITMDKTTLVIPANQNYPIGMKSILVEGNYKLREGAFYADIKKDGYSKGFAAENTVQFINGLINGRPMRGRVIEVEILYQGNDIFVLFSHEVEIQYSPLS
jgi:hypothetical protein